MAVFIDLVMDTGELVRVECPTKHEDALHESIENAMKRRDWWAPGAFDGCAATYLGQRMDRVNMGRVVGMMR
jgi:hypothetical protein